MKKRIFTLLLWCLLLLPALSLPAMAVSGNLDTPKPSRAQLQEKWRQVTAPDSIFLTQPVTTAPYASGALTDSLLRSGLTYLNYVRFAAGLPDVQLDDALNADAQHGAVVLAAIDQLTHYPSKPADMDDAFFQRGYDATTSSNLSARFGYNELECLQGAVSGCMDDNSSASNLACLGHRRWLLNPALLNVGFGHASNRASGWQYTVTKVFDFGGGDFDYDYVAWPASGQFPTNLFGTDVPWSVSLNPAKYQAPEAGRVQVTITRQSDGKTWSFSEVNPNPTTAVQAYMTIENSGYGIPNCIIFNPGRANVDTWAGVHTVSITGLRTRDGQDAALNYQVDFFSIDATCPGHNYIPSVTAPTCTQDGYTTYTCQCGDSYQGDTVPAPGHSYGQWTLEQEATETQKGILVRTCTVCGNAERQEVDYGNPFLDVSEDMFYYEPVLWAVKEGITTGTSAYTFTPDGTCTRAQIVTFLWRSAGSPAAGEGSNPFTDVPEGQWYTDAVLWAVEEGITTGTSATTFSPDASCTRGQVATFLWRAKGEPASAADNIFTDITSDAYYYSAVLWAVENGITNGMGDGTFAPDAPCTRGQIVTFLHRAANIAPDDG